MNPQHTEIMDALNTLIEEILADDKPHKSKRAGAVEIAKVRVAAITLPPEKIEPFEIKLRADRPGGPGAA